MLHLAHEMSEPTHFAERLARDDADTSLGVGLGVASRPLPIRGAGRTKRFAGEDVAERFSPHGSRLLIPAVPSRAFAQALHLTMPALKVYAALVVEMPVLVVQLLQRRTVTNKGENRILGPVEFQRIVAVEAVDIPVGAHVGTSRTSRPISSPGHIGNPGL
jgi:hypothetical protein